jgi:bifunctional non-homologous end joining protein LigD
MKIDGYRALAFKADQEVRLVSRNRNSFNDDYPLLIDSLKSLKPKSFIVDGEVAALDEDGRPSFQLLQSYGAHKRTPLVYYTFNLLSLEGSDLRSRPLIERRELLAKLLKKAPENIKFSEQLRGSREELLQVARQFKLEGLTAKRANSLYESGRRSGAWVKVKLTQEQEFVIGGYTPPEGSRKYFGSLLFGYYGTGGLLFAGRVGDRILRKSLGDSLRWHAKDQTHQLPFHQPARNETRSVGAWHHPCGYETVQLGRAVACRSDQVHRVD